jgi:hypothetical protein
MAVSEMTTDMPEHRNRKKSERDGAGLIRVLPDGTSSREDG